MPTDEGKSDGEKVYPIPDSVLIEWQKMSESSRELSKAVERARSQAMSAHVLMLAVVATWFAGAFLTSEGRTHRADFWMYLLAAQVAYYFGRQLFSKSE